MCADEYQRKWWHALLDNSADWDAAFANPLTTPDEIVGLYSRLPTFTIPGNTWKISFRSQADIVYGGSVQFTWWCIDKPCAPTTYDELTNAFMSKISEVVAAEIPHDRKSARSVRWLKQIVQQTNR